MNKHTYNKKYDPASYDLHFDFNVDLEFNLFDYFILGLYLLFVFPFVLLGRVCKSIYAYFTGEGSKGKSKQALQPPLKGAFSLISKIF